MDLTAIKDDAPVADFPYGYNIVTDQHYGAATAGESSHESERFPLKAGVANRKGFVEQHYLGIEMGGS